MIAYCDFIADRVRKSLLASQKDYTEPVHLAEISKIEYDLGPRGEFASTKKTMHIFDGNGKEYRITVEEV
jgi:hypothetical protein